MIPGEFIIPKWGLTYFIEVIDTQGNGRMVPDLEEEMPYGIVNLERQQSQFHSEPALQESKTLIQLLTINLIDQKTFFGETLHGLKREYLLYETLGNNYLQLHAVCIHG